MTFRMKPTGHRLQGLRGGAVEDGADAGMRCSQAGEARAVSGFLCPGESRPAARGLLAARTREDEQTTPDLATESRG